MKTHLVYPSIDELNQKISQRGFWKEIPEKETVVPAFVNEMFGYLFPISENCLPGEMQLNQKFLNVYKLFRKLYLPIFNQGCSSQFNFEDDFFSSLPTIFDLLLEDAQSIFEGDPAANQIDEVIHIYPGFFAIFVYRVAHLFHQLKQSVIARMLSEYAHSKTGIDIHPGATIGKSFGIDHGTGIVIGETSIIGDHVKLYQGVTLGAKNVDKGLIAVKRHPTIEDHVVIYAGATILGGNTVIGHDSVIGGNVFITHSINPCTMVYYQNSMASKALCNNSHPIEFIN